MRKTVAGTTSDPTIQFTDLEIDEKKYKLLYNFNAIATAEVVANANLMLGISGLYLNTANAGQYRGLLYAALIKAHPNMTIDSAGSLIRPDTLPDVRLGLLRAYNEAIPEKKRFQIEVADEPDPPAES